MSKNVDKSSGPRGQTVVRSFGRDDSSFTRGVSNDEAKNGKLSGSPTDLSHSLTGASAVQHVEGRKKSETVGQ